MIFRSVVSKPRIDTTERNPKNASTKETEMSKAKRREQQKRRAAFVATIADEGGAYWLGEADGCEFGYRRDGVCFEGSFSETHIPGSHVLTAP